MNLKSFHFVFITLAILLLALCAGMEWSTFQRTDATAHRTSAVGFGAAALVLAAYEVWFFFKTRRIIIG